MYRTLFYIGTLTYIVLVIFSVIFYKERIVFTDAAYSTFYLTQTGNFAIQHLRFGEVLLQILPVLGIKAGLSLNSIILLYSLSFALYYFICYLLCGLVFKNYPLALALLLFNILFCTYTYYYMISELPMAVAMLLVLVAWLSNRPAIKWYHVFILLVILATIVSYHPLTLFIVLFTLTFFYLQRNGILTKRKLLIMAACYVVVFTIKRTFFTDEYDLQTTAATLKNVSALFPHYFNTYSNKTFLQNCIDKYYWIPILTMVITIIYIRCKHWLKLSLFLPAVIGYLLLVNVCYPNDITTNFYIENLYFPLAFFIGLPFVIDIIPVLQKTVVVILFSLIAITACIRIYNNKTLFTDRLNWERDFLNKHLDEKLIVKATPEQTKVLPMTWGTPYEFWLLSTTEYQKTASIIITDQPDPTYVGIKDQLILTWGQFPYKALPSRYFILNDTITGYKLMQ